MRMWLPAIALISVFMAVLMYLTWGAEPNRAFYLCISSIPVALLGILALVYLVVRASIKLPVLMTARSQGVVVATVGQVLDRHGIPWTQSTLSPGERREEDKVMLGHLSFDGSGPEVDVISFDNGRIGVWLEPMNATHLVIEPKDALSPEVMGDIAEALDGAD